LAEIGHERQIRVFTRHYQVASLLARHPDLIATLPSNMARLHADHPKLCVHKPPFMIIPIELQMAWSPLLQHDSGHTRLRRLIVEMGKSVTAGEQGLQV